MWSFPRQALLVNSFHLLNVVMCSLIRLLCTIFLRSSLRLRRQAIATEVVQRREAVAFCGDKEQLLVKESGIREA